MPSKTWQAGPVIMTCLLEDRYRTVSCPPGSWTVTSVSYGKRPAETAAAVAAHAPVPHARVGPAPCSHTRRSSKSLSGCGWAKPMLAPRGKAWVGGETRGASWSNARLSRGVEADGVWVADVNQDHVRAWFLAGAGCRRLGGDGPSEHAPGRIRARAVKSGCRVRAGIGENGQGRAHGRFHVERDAADPIAAHLRAGAVGIEDCDLPVDACGRAGLDHEDSVGANAEMAIAQVRYGCWRERLGGQAGEQQKVISQSMQLRERHRHWGFVYGMGASAARDSRKIGGCDRLAVGSGRATPQGVSCAGERTCRA